MELIRVAAVQAAPVWLDRGATIERVVSLAEEAAANGAGLVAFSEAFVPGYPDWVWRTRPWDANASALYARLLDQAVVVGSSATDELADTARRLGIWLSVGVDELDTASTTLYNTLLHFPPDGAPPIRHRKLMSTGGERLVWGMGDGSTVKVIETRFGRLGGLICWENYMPLARTSLYAQGIDILLAPTWDNSDAWVSTLRHVAKEGRIFVIGITACIRGADVPSDVPGHDELYPDPTDWLSQGNSTIVGPEGDVLAGPLIGETGILYADLDVGRARALRHKFDPVGHYGRGDVFTLTVNSSSNRVVTFDDDAAGDSSPEG